MGRVKKYSQILTSQLFSEAKVKQGKLEWMANLGNLCPNGQSFQDTACVDWNYPDKCVRVPGCTFRQCPVLQQSDREIWHCDSRCLKI